MAISRVRLIVIVYHILNYFLFTGIEAHEDTFWTPAFVPPLDLSEANLESTCHHLDVTNYLKHLANTFSNISKLVSIGNSTQGRELWTIVISGNQNQNERALLKPQVKFVGNINGFSGPSCVVLVKLIKFLLGNYYVDEELRRLVDSTEIHILPNMNPDGYAESLPGECHSNRGRRNAKGVELNRNFPDLFYPTDDNEDDPEREKETLAIMEWINENNFIMSASFISGAEVISYPYDSTPLGYPTGLKHEVPAPDDKTFQFLARNYVGFVKEQQRDILWFCPILGQIFPEGFINGAEWKSVSGTMMDYNYFSGTFEILVGLGCCKNDNNTDKLEQIWLNNKAAMLSIIRGAEYSFRGQVLHSETNLPLKDVTFTMHLPGDNHHPDEGDVRIPFFSNARGEFWRILVPGKYYLSASLRGFEKQLIEVDVSDDEPLQILVIKMKPIKLGRRRQNVRIIQEEVVQVQQKVEEPIQSTPTVDDNGLRQTDEIQTEQIFEDSVGHELEPYPKALTETHTGNFCNRCKLSVHVHIFIFILGRLCIRWIKVVL